MKRLATTCASLVIGHAIAAVPQLSPYAVPPARADGTGLNQAALISSVLPSVVNISVNKKVAGQGGDADGGNTEIKRFVGSGFIIEGSGLVMTNYHVVQDALDIMVTLSDGTRLPGKAENASRLADLALVKIEPPRPLQAIRWGEGVHVGDEVFAAGDPFGIGTSVSAGIVSGLNRDIQNSPYDDMIQTDATINHGNSGGPLFNMQGEVVGVDSAIISPTSGSSGLGFAIPASSAQFVADQLRKYGWVHPGWIGLKVQTVTPDISSAAGLPKPQGAIVSWVFPNGPAKQAGVRIGDAVLAFNGKPLTDERALLRDIAHTSEGSAISLRIWRDGAEHDVSMTTQGWPRDQWNRLDAPVKAAADTVRIPRDLGLSLADLTPKQQQALEEKGEASGVMITTVAGDTDVARRGLASGDIIVRVQGRPVRTPAEVQAGIETLRAEKRDLALLLIQPKVADVPGPRWIAVQIGPKDG